MVIEFKWNNKVYTVNAFSVALQSAGSMQLADCIPGTIQISLEELRSSQRRQSGNKEEIE